MGEAFKVQGVEGAQLPKVQRVQEVQLSGMRGFLGGNGSPGKFRLNPFERAQTQLRTLCSEFAPRLQCLILQYTVVHSRIGGLGLRSLQGLGVATAQGAFSYFDLARPYARACITCIRLASADSIAPKGFRVRFACFCISYFELAGSYAPARITSIPLASAG